MKKNKKRRNILKSILIIFICIVLYTIYGINKIKSEEILLVYKIKCGDIENTIKSKGKIMPKGKVINNKSQFTGKIKNVKIKKGDYVKKGDIVATIIIEDKMIENLNDELVAIDNEIEKYECDKYEYVKTIIDGRITINCKEGDDSYNVIKEKNSLALVEHNDKNVKSLSSYNGIVDKIYVTNGQVVEANQTIIRIYHSEDSEYFKKIMEKRERILEDIKNIKDGELDIKCENEGYIINVNISNGLQVNADDVIYEQKTDVAYKIYTYIDEYNVENIFLGKKADIVFEGNEKYTGVVENIKKADIISESNKYIVTLKLDYMDNMKSGMSVDVKFEVEKKQDVIYIPQNCIGIDKDGRTFVVIYTGKRNAKKYVTTGIASTDNIEIIDGIEIGSMVIDLRMTDDISWFERLLMTGFYGPKYSMQEY